MSTAIQKVDPEKFIEFVPFAAADKIRLSVRMAQNHIATRTTSGKTCSDNEAMKFVLFCQAQRLNPWAGDAFLVGYDTKDGAKFSLITAHQALLKRAESCQEFKGMESGIVLLQEDGTVIDREADFYLPEEKVVGGWARVHREGRLPTYRRIRMSRFNKGRAQWEADAAGMICKCAEADALRSTFPSLMGGLYNEGEQSRAVIEVSTVTTDLPAAGSKLVAFTQPAAEPEGEQAGEGQESEPEPVQEARKAVQDAKMEPQDQLANIVIKAGFTFDDFVTWALDLGHLKAGDEPSGFNELSVELCSRMVKAQKGLVAGLTIGKAGGQ